jgi:hypothetical protein
MNFLSHPDKFEERHIGPSKIELEEMAKYWDLDRLTI